jgi:hypothetical protein
MRSVRKQARGSELCWLRLRPAHTPIFSFSADARRRGASLIRREGGRTLCSPHSHRFREQQNR